MKKEKVQQIRSNVISLRVTDEEKAVIERIRRDSEKSFGTLVVEALQQYALWPASHCQACFFQGKKEIERQAYLN